MSAEEAFANNREWAQERGEVELKHDFPFDLSVDPMFYEQCRVDGCKKTAFHVYVIGRVDRGGGKEVPLCEKHSDLEAAFDCYQ